jgi:hypothetical protein
LSTDYKGIAAMAFFLVVLLLRPWILLLTAFLFSD